jgi:hypothetical protein
MGHLNGTRTTTAIGTPSHIRRVASLTRKLACASHRGLTTRNSVRDRSPYVFLVSLLLLLRIHRL